MVEIAINQVIELKNERRVCRSLRKFTDSQKRTWLLAADMMFASANMNGKFKLISLPAILG
jgi:hypothetical protein